MNIILPLVVVHNPQKLQQQLKETRKAIQKLAYDELESLLGKTAIFNEGVEEAQPWIDIISDEMTARTDLVESIKEFAMASVEAKDNAKLLLVDHLKYQDECMRRMDRLDKANNTLLALPRPLPHHAPYQLANYLNASANKGCQACWLSSGGDSHEECISKMRIWFLTRDALVEYGMNLQ